MNENSEKLVVGQRVIVKGLGAGTIKRIVRPGTMRTRFNVSLDNPPEDWENDTFDCGKSELEIQV